MISEYILSLLRFYTHIKQSLEKISSLLIVLDCDLGKAWRLIQSFKLISITMVNNIICYLLYSFIFLSHYLYNHCLYSWRYALILKDRSCLKQWFLLLQEPLPGAEWVMYTAIINPITVGQLIYPNQSCPLLPSAFLPISTKAG